MAKRSTSRYQTSEGLKIVRESIHTMGWDREALNKLKALFSHYVPAKYLEELTKKPGYEAALYVVFGEKLERLYNQGQRDNGFYWISPEEADDVDDFIQTMLYGHKQADRWIPGLLAGLKPFEVVQKIDPETKEKKPELIGLLGHKSGYDPSRGGTIPGECPDCGQSFWSEDAGGSGPVPMPSEVVATLADKENADGTPLLDLPTYKKRCGTLIPVLESEKEKWPEEALVHDETRGTFRYCSYPITLASINTWASDFIKNSKSRLYVEQLKHTQTQTFYVCPYCKYKYADIEEKMRIEPKDLTKEEEEEGIGEFSDYDVLCPSCRREFNLSVAKKKKRRVQKKSLDFAYESAKGEETQTLGDQLIDPRASDQSLESLYHERNQIVSQLLDEIERITKDWTDTEAASAANFFREMIETGDLTGNELVEKYTPKVQHYVECDDCGWIQKLPTEISLFLRKGGPAIGIEGGKGYIFCPNSIDSATKPAHEKHRVGIKTEETKEIVPSSVPAEKVEQEDPFAAAEQIAKKVPTIPAVSPSFPKEQVKKEDQLFEEEEQKPASSPTPTKEVDPLFPATSKAPKLQQLVTESLSGTPLTLRSQRETEAAKTISSEQDRRRYLGLNITYNGPATMNLQPSRNPQIPPIVWKIGRRKLNVGQRLQPPPYNRIVGEPIEQFPAWPPSEMIDPSGQTPEGRDVILYIHQISNRIKNKVLNEIASEWEQVPLNIDGALELEIHGRKYSKYRAKPGTIRNKRAYELFLEWEEVSQKIQLQADKMDLKSRRY